MKTRKIILTVLLMMTGLFTAKAQYYTYPAELALVSQPVMTYMPNAVRLYYDVQNIGDVRYLTGRGEMYRNTEVLESGNTETSNSNIKSLIEILNRTLFEKDKQIDRLLTIIEQRKV